MKTYYNLFCYLLFILFLPGCGIKQEQKITEMLSGIREKYAPDARIALFDVEFSRNSRLFIKGETSIESAFHELDSFLKADFPEIHNQVVLLPDPALNGMTRGIVTVSVANLRGIPDHSAELVSQALLGTPVKILKKEKNWYLIQTPDSYLGWITESSLFLCNEQGLYDNNNWDRIIISDLTGTCYELTDINSRPVTDVVAGCIIKTTGSVPRFWKVRLPDGRSGYIDKNHGIILKKWKESFPPTQKAIVETAIRFLGLPYLWGGMSSKGLDCSGFTKTVFFINGIILQRDASQQALYGEPVDASANYKYLEPGDLLFFGNQKTDSTDERITHVGIYIGSGDIIHSSSGAGYVKINSLAPGKENYNAYLDSIFICSRRILTCVGQPGIESVFSNELYMSAN